MSVVLPAPLGPSNPVTPWPMPKLADDSAVVAPKRLTTPSPAATGPGAAVTAEASGAAMRANLPVRLRPPQRSSQGHARC